MQHPVTHSKLDGHESSVRRGNPIDLLGAEGIAVEGHSAFCALDDDVRRDWHAAIIGEPRHDEGMRVVAGTFKGQRLEAPKRGSTRPTADRVREALFSMLASVDGARVLDLYAGS